MPSRRLLRSPFRPADPPDRSLLDENRALVQDINRRGVLRGTISLGALTMLSGCNVTDHAAVKSVLQRMSEFNDRAQAAIFDPGRLAPTYAESKVLRPPRFNAYYPVEEVRRVDGATWRLELAGLIANKRAWSRDEIYALPETEMVIRHICVEGWDYIGQWSGPTLRSFLERVGADLSAKYVAFKCADDYHGSIDMATALHPQTLLATKYAKEILPEPFGYPLRLRTSTKLGFKNPKHITAIEVTNQYPGGYWENLGFNWFAGI